MQAACYKQATYWYPDGLDTPTAWFRHWQDPLRGFQGRRKTFWTKISFDFKKTTRLFYAVTTNYRLPKDDSTLTHLLVIMVHHYSNYYIIHKFVSLLSI
jgi:hypothetical protein